MWKQVLCLIVFNSLIQLISTISLNKRCGTKICDMVQYCSKFTNQCEPCDQVCNKLQHNYDVQQCEMECQDYLLDLRYARQSALIDVSKEVMTRLTILTIITLVLLLIFLVIHGFHLIRWLRRRGWCNCNFRFNRKKTVPTPPTEIHANPNTDSPGFNRRTSRPDVPERQSTVFSIQTGVDTLHTVSTPLSGRHPAEDSTLSYSYDNGALQITPVSDKPKGMGPI